MSCSQTTGAIKKSRLLGLQTDGKVPQNPFRPPMSASRNRNEDDTAATGERYHESQKWVSPTFFPLMIVILPVESIAGMLCSLQKHLPTLISDVEEILCYYLLLVHHCTFTPTSHPFHCAKNCVLLATLDVLGSDA